jgi:hypothetical protein
VLPLVFINIVNGADMGMIQGRSGPGFPLESLDSLVVMGQLFGQELQGDDASEFGVFGFIDDPHPSSTHQLVNLVFSGNDAAFG